MKNTDQTKQAMRISMYVAVLMLFGKITAFWLTKSTAILSDAAESVVHIAATGAAVLGLWYTHQPSTHKHPYGYGKIAYFSAGFEGAMIFCAGLSILFIAIKDWIIGPQLQQLGIGLSITAALCLINLLLGLYLIRTGKKHNQLILVSNGKHVMTDMYTSLGVLLGITLVALTNQLWLDPAVAIIIACQILFSGGSLLRDSFHGLMDKADAKIHALIVDTLDNAVAEKEISAYHELRHRCSNDMIWIEMHILMEGNLPLHQTHQSVTEIERKIQNKLPTYQVFITSHMEPQTHEEAHPEGHIKPGKSA